MAARKNPSKGGKPDKLMRDALLLELHQTAADADGIVTKKLRLVARKLVDKAIEGYVSAIREIHDRIDGRVPQENTVILDDKRDATDWTRGELVAFLDDARDGRQRASQANGCGGEPDKVH